MRLSGLIALLLALLLASCSRQAEAPIEVSGKGAPALWHVTKPDGKSGSAWLFGTVHSLPADTDWQGPQLDAAIRASDGLIIEVNGLEHKQDVARIFASMGVAGGLPTLRSRVPASQHPALDHLIATSNVPPAMLDRMKTWAAMLTLASASRSGWGLDTASGVEGSLQLRFKGDSKAVSGLESVQQQFAMFDSLPEADQRAMLVHMLGSAKTARADFEKMLHDWMAGRSDQLLDKADEGLLASPTVREALLDGRNRAWANEIARLIERDERPFVAVGAGHMAGPAGVPALLKAKGYRVERTQ